MESEDAPRTDVRGTARREIWRDTTRDPALRVDDLLARMTLPEKIAQLYGIWVGADADGDGVAPLQHEQMDTPIDWQRAIRSGLGQLTRPFGTAPVDPALGARALAKSQAEIAAAGRFGIPAIAHEECLAGFTAWGATIYPVPLAWGASFDPALVEPVAARIGAAMRGVGIHQGLAPVLDVSRDPRWGRTEETIGEDPYLVGTVGAAYVRGLQSAGIVATLKHFVGYSASRAGRNLAPVSIGSRELADVLLVPFEMALRDGGARSVMHAYTGLDGVPSGSDPELLTALLRDRWGFAGTVVADYFAVSFLESLHGVADGPQMAARLALTAGVDVELPTVHCYGEPLLTAVRDGLVDGRLVDRAARRVLLQKCELGLLDPDWSPLPGALAAGDAVRGAVDLDPAPSRDLARRLAEESVVLLANTGALPLAPGQRVAVVGPLAHDTAAMLGCYSFPSHVGALHPDVPVGVDIATVLDALRGELSSDRLEHEMGCAVDGDGTSGIAAAVAAAGRADACVAVLGDRAGLFGRGTSGEGCDAADLHLPGVQGRLLDALLDTGTPVVLVLLTGRPYALGRYASRAAAIVQAFFPGEEGGGAVAGVLTGRVNPSGRLPVSVPRSPGGQPATYLAPKLGRLGRVSAIDPTPAYPFGHGLSYTRFAWDDVRVSGNPVPGVAAGGTEAPRAVAGDGARDDGVTAGGEPVPWPTDAAVRIGCTVRNTGARAGTEVVQLYLHDPVAEVARPVAVLIGYTRVDLRPGEARRVEFTVHADLTSYTGRAGRRIVEPGEVVLRLAPSSAAPGHCAALRLTGPTREVGRDRQLTSTAEITPA